MILASQQWIDTRPALVQGFVDATMEGWRDYLYGNPQPANALIMRDNPEMTPGLIAQAIAKMKSYGIAGPAGEKGANIGEMTDAHWKQFFDTMVSERLYPRTLDYRKAYTLKFVAK
jgi:NitT/TauT family transport system substrate-binding protein